MVTELYSKRQRNAPTRVVEPDAQNPALSDEPEPAADGQELQQVQHALELIKSGQIENFDQVELIPG